MKKLLIGIFICFGFILAMSHNVFAIEPVFDITNYEYTYYLRNPSYTCNYTDGTTSTGNNCLINPSRSLRSIVSQNTFVLKAGDLVETYIMAFSGSTFTTGETASGNLSGNLYISTAISSARGDVLSFEPVILHSDSEVINYYDYWNLRTAGTSQNLSGYPEITTGYQHFSIYKVLIRINQDFNTNGGNFTLVGSDASPLIYYAPVYNSQVQVYFPYFKVWRPIQTKQEEAAEKEIESSENIENQTPPSQNETGDGQSATNLIGAFSGFVSALGGLSATNCNLTLNFPSFAGGTRVVNVCQNKDKAGNIISVFSSLTLIIFYVPLAIRLLTMIYNEIRSFTNG